MRAEKVVKYLLENAAGVTALVGTKIYAFPLPQKTTSPALVYSKVSSVDVPPVNAFAGSNIALSRVQVTAFAVDYPSVKNLLEEVRKALSYQSGLINGVQVVSVLPDIEGPDLYELSLVLPYQSRDFLITHYQ
jgi:hypothetical protein